MLIDFSRSVLNEDLFLRREGASPVSRPPRVRRLVAMLSGENTAAKRMAAELLKRLPAGGRVLVVGGGAVGSGAESLYEAGVVVGLDIYPSPHTAVVADAHSIPFTDATFDAVWIQAVLEHVVSPEQVVREVHRVLKPGGYVFADTPFLQHVHEGAYDFTRFTLSGHRWLFRDFRALEVGVTGGAGSTLTWALKYFARAVTGSDTLGKVVGLAFWWLRLFDGTSQAHEDAACGTYFFGRKSAESLAPRDLIAFYENRANRPASLCSKSAALVPDYEIRLENGFDFLSAEYRALFERARASAFQHPLWLDGFYRMLAPASGAEPLILTARRREDGRLALVLPLLRRWRGALRVVEYADLGVSDYVAPVCDEATFERLAADPAVRQQIGRLLKPCDLVWIKKAPETALPLHRLLPNGRRSAMEVKSHACALFGPFDVWRDRTLNTSFAKELLKKRRQLARVGVLRLEQVREPGAVGALLDELRALRSARFPDDPLHDPRYFDFYKALALAGAETGFASAYRLTLDGASLGGVWGLRYDGCFLMLISALRYEAHPRQSLGSLAIEEVARSCIEDQLTLLDFTVGDESYKASFGAKPSDLWRVIAPATPLGSLAAWALAHRPRPARPAKEGASPP